MSIKSDLYKLVKAIIMGGTFTDACGNEYAYTGISTIKYYMFWNSELLNPDTKDNYPVPALFFEYSNNENQLVQQRITETYNRATTKDLTEFTLHLIYGKFRAENRENDYLEQIDLAAQIADAINGKSVYGIKNINKIREQQDPNSTVLMDWTMTFTCQTVNVGETNLEDVNDPIGTIQVEINPLKYG